MRHTNNSHKQGKMLYFVHTLLTHIQLFWIIPSNEWHSSCHACFQLSCWCLNKPGVWTRWRVVRGHSTAVVGVPSRLESCHCRLCSVVIGIQKEPLYDYITSSTASYWESFNFLRVLFHFCFSLDWISLLQKQSKKDTETPWVEVARDDVIS